jgi:hypothetical protein
VVNGVDGVLVDADGSLSPGLRIVGLTRACRSSTVQCMQA